MNIEIVRVITSIIVTDARQQSCEVLGIRGKE